MCIILCTYQIAVCVTKWLSQPHSTELGLTRASETAFPGFTICSSISGRFKKNLSILAEYDIEPNDIIKFDKLWKKNNSKLMELLVQGDVMNLYNSLTPKIR